MPDIASKDLTTGQAARLCGVSNRTLLNWINKGLIDSYQLPGVRGDHRISSHALTIFMQASGIPVPAHLSQKKKSVLVIDDEKNICLALGRVLRPLEVDCHFAYTAFDAGRLFAKLSPDLITLDIQLPDTNGLSLLKQLRQQQDFASRLMVISGADNLWLREARAIGADAIISKPFDSEKLQEQVKQLLA